MQLEQVDVHDIQDKLTTSRETENSPLYSLMESTYQTPAKAIKATIKAGELKAVRNAVNYHNSKLADGRGKFSTRADLDTKGAGTIYIYLKEAKDSLPALTPTPSQQEEAK